MSIGIVGAGALGTVFGASLAQAHEVRVLVRDERTARAIVDRGGLVIEGLSPRHVGVSHEPSHLAQCEILVVAVKAQDTFAALEPLREILNDNATIVSVQNGIDAAARIEVALGHRRAVAVGSTTEAARLIEPGVVVRAAIGATVLGWAARSAADAAALESLAHTFTACGLATRAVDDVTPELWGKLVVNAALNPVTALARVTNGELLERSELLERALAIAREVVALAAREGIALPFDDPTARVCAVATATARNRSSMLQDVERGRPTEIDAILGTVVRRAAVFGLAVPASEAALDEVRRLTNA